ncbi:hypothetical protein BO94DRAFT_240495 [Aspergillus sclerotioniger CBS 115572]|uniref:Uncharacterized protein n=1 Tax=Aspergillus sclerotioniger CBS 115572 TaxID=1450535 RepID=A0A317VJV0_9EURO|nr:hypothetical protein BO94DRAFT_240495 [Aspergillus sclerotioniger CBS 115572]PWY73132.1 hypothetical protein BO94DRAFT_240495 [Aspergillus sclerotioniger CBS 115572]
MNITPFIDTILDHTLMKITMAPCTAYIICKMIVFMQGEDQVIRMGSTSSKKGCDRFIGDIRPGAGA